MAQTLRAATLAVSIARSPQHVYKFVAAPENLPRWAPAFCLSVRRADNGWLVDTPMGTVKFRFVTANDLGVLDHVVTLDDEEILNPMRVLANGSGSELLFTLFQRPGMTDAQFAEDLTLIERDLNTLKALMEAAP